MQDEISLREILEVLWKGKWIIAAITAVSVIITGIFSFLIISPTYEAVSTVRVDLSQLDQMNHKLYLNSIAESLKTDVAMNRIINKLDLPHDEYSINSVRKSIKVEVVENTNNINLRVNGPKPELITDISNLMAFEMGARFEISDRSQLIVNARKELETLEDSIKVKTFELEEANSQLVNTPEKLITKQTLADEDYLRAIISEGTSINERELGALQLESETINPLYTSLKSQISEITLELTRQRTSKQNYEEEIERHNNIISELEQQLLREDLNTNNSQRLLSGFNAVFIAPALEPSEPVAPNKTLNIAISVVIGIMISIFVILVMHYMRAERAVKSQESIEIN
ncbi:Wzz/FepE/Etk N-terminal domain-containing protein [Xylanibacillus composti]|uniref:Polysaccharide chain length determinant N-terminal domain-containing protein n=1 Tax=Xylanibacillus composti TaxID=1572762 RepID=A0A8J4H7K0_9BACL|nr:Wzz/FepE/Etk N-terminal domain-containing protein [Xylanibacillus composti]GIQ71262.1 hypothetical protein XYCOK13_40860 [Xylanibacillus composti]